MSQVTAALPTVSYVMQGRWWCPMCRVMWAGSWQVNAPIFPVTVEDEDWSAVHDCGTVMHRTSGDERADDD